MRTRTDAAEADVDSGGRADLGAQDPAPAKVVGVVVTYRPDLEKLATLLRTAIGQVSALVVVDNDRPGVLLPWIESQRLGCSVWYLPMGDNTGIGAAQNAGIRAGKDLGATHVILWDQDSLPAAGMVDRLLAGERRLIASGARVAAVGPQLFDEKTGRPFRFMQFPYGLKKWASAAEAKAGHIHTHHLVASGTMMRMSVLDLVGLMREELFLEYVDVEWGLRARAAGLVSYGIVDATMAHSLGESRKTILFGLKAVPLHSPVRHYYTMRNAVFMQSLSYVPLYWKLHDVIRTLASFVFFAMFSAPRREQVAMMLRGFRDGLAGQMGRWSTQPSRVLATAQRVKST